MPIRTVTLSNGKVCTRKITNLRSDGTEFNPEEIIIGETSGTERAAEILKRILKHTTEKERKENARHEKERAG